MIHSHQQELQIFFVSTTSWQAISEIFNTPNHLQVQTKTKEHTNSFLIITNLNKREKKYRGIYQNTSLQQIHYIPYFLLYLSNTLAEPKIIIISLRKSHKYLPHTHIQMQIFRTLNNERIPSIARVIWLTYSSKPEGQSSHTMS